MIDRIPLEPTAEQCNTGAKATLLVGGEPVEGYACWYPQMGGYVGKAFVMPRGGCFDVLIWHDGTFPFGDEQSPVSLHHCDPQQFIDFGQFVQSLPGVR